MKKFKVVAAIILPLTTLSFLFVNGAKGPLKADDLQAAIAEKYKSREDWEQKWMLKSLKSADAWAKKIDEYSPSMNTEETPPTNFAVEGLALIRAHKVAGVLGDTGRQEKYALRISLLANSLAKNSNVDDSSFMQDFYNRVYGDIPANKGKRGLTGWGRFYPVSEGPDNVYQGGYTYFNYESNCNPKDSRNRSQIDRAYIEDLFDQAWVTRFLLEAALLLPSSPSAQNWKDIAKASIDSFLKKSATPASGTFNLPANLPPATRALIEAAMKRSGSQGTPQGSYAFAWSLDQNGTKRLYLNKTTGPCSKDYLVKNTNILMAVAIDLAGQVFGSEYRDVATTMLETENEEIDRNNFGYYSYRHHLSGSSLNGSTKMKKVLAHQENRNGKYECKTTSKTCIGHITLELISYNAILRQRNLWSDAYGERLLKIVDHFNDKTREVASSPVEAFPTQTVAHACSIRNMPRVSATNYYIDAKEYCRQNLDEYEQAGKSASSTLALSFLE